MTLVPSLPEDVNMMSPKEYWELDPGAVHFGRTEGDVEKERKVVERIKELGLLEHKIHMEKQLMSRLENLMQEKDALYSVLNQCRRKRPIKERLSHTLSEIRSLINPSITRDSAGRRLHYNVQVLMGFFTTNVKYRVERNTRIVVVYGETPDDDDKLTKEVVLEFPLDVDMARVDAEYTAGVFKVSIPFTSNRSVNSSDEHSMLSGGDSESLPSVDCQSMTSLDGQSMTSSDDVRTDLLSPGSEADENAIVWV